MLRIGFYSETMQSGKTTASKYLQEKYNCHLISFATPIKDMITVILQGLCYSEKEIERRLYGDGKEETVEELGKSVRDLMLSLGTTWGRELVDENIWTTITYNKIGNNAYVCDDVRRLNEAELLKHCNFKLIRIYNPNASIVKNIAEGFLVDYEFDYVIENNGTLQEFYSKLDRVVEDIKHGR